MLLYNITYGIDLSIEQDWLQWMKQQFVPAVMASGKFTSWKMYKVLHDQGEGTVSYSVQYIATEISHVVEFVEQIEPELNKELLRKYRDRHVAFRTLLEQV